MVDVPYFLKILRFYKPIKYQLMADCQRVRSCMSLVYLLSLDDLATCSRTFSWPQTEDSTVFIFQMWSALFSPLQCLEELECSHFYFKLKPFKDWGKQENTHTCSHLFSIALNYYQPMFAQTHWQWTRDKRSTIVNSPRLERQGSHTPLRSHSIWQKVRRKCLEETIKGLETKIFSVDQAFWIWWTSKLSSENRSHLHK